MPNCTSLPYSFLLPAVLFICLNPGNVLLLHCLTLLQHFFFQGFKRQAGQPGMLRQLAGPLRQIKKKKKGELFTFLLHAQTKPPMSYTHIHTQSFCTNDWVVCVWSSCLLCVVFSSLVSTRRVGKSAYMPPKTPFPDYKLINSCRVCMCDPRAAMMTKDY